MKRWIACLLIVVMLLVGAIGGAEGALTQSANEPTAPPEETVAAAPAAQIDVPIATPEPTDLTLSARGSAVQALQERLRQLFNFIHIDWNSGER